MINLKIKKNTMHQFLPNWWIIYDENGYCYGYLKTKLLAQRTKTILEERKVS